MPASSARDVEGPSLSVYSLAALFLLSRRLPVLEIREAVKKDQPELETAGLFRRSVLRAKMRSEIGRAMRATKQPLPLRVPPWAERVAVNRLRL
jgi:hypothetical protein